MRSPATSSRAAQTIQWATLPPEVLRVLRAGALIGPGFETSIVADLLSLEPLEVLERLQQATDLGVPVEDRAEGRFSLADRPRSRPVGVADAPSLAQAWHRRLGRRLGRAPVRTPGRGRHRRRWPAPPGRSRSASGSRAPARPWSRRSSTSPRRSSTWSWRQMNRRPRSPRTAARPRSSSPSRPRRPRSPVNRRTCPRRQTTSANDSRPAAQALKAAVVDPRDVGAPAPTLPVRGAPRRKTIIAPSVRTAKWGAAAEDPTPEPAAPEATPVATDPSGWGEASRAAPARIDEPLIDEARAAEHLRLAGEFDAAAQHLCEAARKAADMGAPQAAAQHASGALATLATMPSSPARRHFEGRGAHRARAAAVAVGRLRPRVHAGPGAGDARGGPRRARWHRAGRPRRRAGADAIAGVCFDLGDARALERALAELVSATEMLDAAGDPTGAACLPHADQAAVLVRMGDPVRALQLLRQSRQAFDARGHDDPIALRELAETEHLFASLPLYAQLRPGREQEGYAMGLDHAVAAERAYRELGEVRELGRVGRRWVGSSCDAVQLEPATQRLEAAVAVQNQLGDLTGLAQTTEALSEVRAACGRDAEAVTLLRDSVVFNRDKG